MSDLIRTIDTDPEEAQPDGGVSSGESDSNFEFKMDNDQFFKGILGTRGKNVQQSDQLAGSKQNIIQ